jgi:2,5-diketo-D-gluconate reductase B
MRSVASPPEDAYLTVHPCEVKMPVSNPTGSIPCLRAYDAEIPVLGYGTYGMRGEGLLRMVQAALKAGFRHIDTAQVYRNEEEIGESVALSGIPRRDVFLTTKVWVTNYHPSRFAVSVDESLRKLRTDYIDLLLLHWPMASIPLAEQLGALNAVVRAGKVRHIGVSNYNRALLEQAIQLSDIPLVTNQFEYHPYLKQSTLISSTREADMAVTAYCGMAVGRVFDEPLLIAIAARYGKSVSQIVLRWLIQQEGVVALSRTSHEKRVAENIAVFDFELASEDMTAIHDLAQSSSRIVSPPGLSPKWD